MRFHDLKIKIARMLSVLDKTAYRIFRIFTKIDEKLIIFEGTKGRFDESSWVLYHYLRKKGTYKFAWMVREPKQYSSSKDTIFINRYHPILNIKADYYYAKARYSFYTHDTSSTLYKRPGQTKVFIGHGYAIKGHKGESDYYNNFDYALAMGKEAILSQSRFIGCTPGQLVPLGLPRNDLLLQNSRPGIENPLTQGLDIKKVIIWMPTFRESRSPLSETRCITKTGLPLFDTEQKVIQLNDYLKKNKCAIVLKPHRLQLQKEVFKKNFSNIIIANDSDISSRNLQLYEFIGISDALISDYSSVSVDYLLLDKPIGYIINDLEYYQKDRGFTSEDPRDVMAGELICTIKDMFRFIDNTLSGQDNYSKKRESLRKRLHAASTGNSCELIDSFFRLS